MTTIDTQGNKHRAAGTPGGGQFDGHVRTTPEDSLSEVPTAQPLTLEEIEQLAAEREARAALRERWEEVRQVTSTTAQGLARSWRLSPDAADDIVQDVAVNMLASRRDIDDQLAQPDTYLKEAARRRAVKYTAAHQHKRRSEDIAALRLLQAEEARFTEAHDRKMTPSERLEAADRIRESFPVGARPKADFHVQRATYSLDAETDDGFSLSDTLADDTEKVRHDEADRMAAFAQYELDSGTTSGRASVRKSSWRIVSIRNGAPQVREGSLNRAMAAKSRELVSATPGGVMGVLDRWEQGEATPVEESVLFAPFGGDDLDMHGCQQVADTLRRHPKVADALYVEAVRAATAGASRR
ncbi:hypothetical protein [Microbacterium sp.]|uniref:hypothetical protein n=2 Tax=Microbacterium sp. TaxID=51671 RepID=UPI003F98E369